jgi:hypothetical protein
VGVFSSQKMIEIILDDLSPIANRLIEHFRSQGYEVLAKQETTGWDVSISKGGIFKMAVGLQTALRIEIRPQLNGTLVTAGIKMLGRRAVPALVARMVYPPALVGQVWGLIRQASLDNEAITVVETELRRHVRLGLGRIDLDSTASATETDTPVLPARVQGSITTFCTSCGNQLDGSALCCANCGQPRPAVSGVG